MFKDRAIQVRMVKSVPSGDTTDTTAVQTLSTEQINEIAGEQIRNLAIAVGGVMAASTLLTTVSKIAVINAKRKIR
jgi:hypothetical protein